MRDSDSSPARIIQAAREKRSIDPQDMAVKEVKEVKEIKEIKADAAYLTSITSIAPSLQFGSH